MTEDTMSALFFNDTGRRDPFTSEAVSKYRWIRKRLELPELASGTRSTVYIHAGIRMGTTIPLTVLVNDHRFEIPPPTDESILRWESLPLSANILKPGENEVMLLTDSPALDTWFVGIDGSVENVGSAVSDDGGRSWRNRNLGIRHCLSGEHIIRIRLHDDALIDPEPPDFVGESNDAPGMAELRSSIPEDVRAAMANEPWLAVRKLASWTSSLWPYANSAGAAVEYSPWHALTIKRWGEKEMGLLKPKPIAMCVHYAVFFCSAAVSLGIPARCVCCTGGLDGGSGHFVCEAWIGQWNKWCHIDPNCDLFFESDGAPLSMSETSRRRDELASLVVKGPNYQNLSERVRNMAETFITTGNCYRLSAVWPRNDFLSRPDLTPPAHGFGSYSETDWCWSGDVRGDELGMFPYVGSPSQSHGV